MNCIHHMLQPFPYREVEKAAIVLPERERHEDYYRQPTSAAMLVPEAY